MSTDPASSESDSVTDKVSFSFIDPSSSSSSVSESDFETHVSTYLKLYNEVNGDFPQCAALCEISTTATESDLIIAPIDKTRFQDYQGKVWRSHPHKGLLFVHTSTVLPPTPQQLATSQAHTQSPYSTFDLNPTNDQLVRQSLTKGITLIERKEMDVSAAAWDKTKLPIKSEEELSHIETIRFVPPTQGEGLTEADKEAHLNAHRNLQSSSASATSFPHLKKIVSNAVNSGLEIAPENVELLQQIADQIWRTDPNTGLLFVDPEVIKKSKKKLAK